MEYELHFERVGRGLRDETHTFTAGGADDLAQQVHRFAARHLRSPWFEVDINLEAGTGLIEWGRFGKFTIKELT